MKLPIVSLASASIFVLVRACEVEPPPQARPDTWAQRLADTLPAPGEKMRWRNNIICLWDTNQKQQQVIADKVHQIGDKDILLHENDVVIKAQRQELLAKERQIKATVKTLSYWSPHCARLVASTLRALSPMPCSRMTWTPSRPWREPCGGPCGSGCGRGCRVSLGASAVLSSS